MLDTGVDHFWQGEAAAEREACEKVTENDTGERSCGVPRILLGDAGRACLSSAAVGRGSVPMLRCRSRSALGMR
eukprot:scaffold16116_cov111-Isochrysis_galbana.AAC.3